MEQESAQCVFVDASHTIAEGLSETRRPVIRPMIYEIISVRHEAAQSNALLAKANAKIEYLTGKRGYAFENMSIIFNRIRSPADASGTKCYAES